MSKLIPFVDSVRKIIKRVEARHRGVKIKDTGIYSIGYDEYKTGMQDSTITTILSFILVIALFILGFRIFQAPLLVGVPLLFGIIWAFGITYFLIGRLNLMTVMVATILIGLGIDYSIHILQASSEKEGIRNALKKVGRGIITGALTTSASFFALYFTSFDVLKELGIVVGTGVITTAGATIFMLPAMLKIFGKKIEEKNLKAGFLGRFAKRIEKTGLVFPIIISSLLVVSLFLIKRIKTTANPIELEAKGLSSVETQKEVVKRFGMSADYISVLAETFEEACSIARYVKKLPG